MTNYDDHFFLKENMKYICNIINNVNFLIKRSIDF